MVQASLAESTANAFSSSACTPSSSGACSSTSTGWLEDSVPSTYARVCVCLCVCAFVCTFFCCSFPSFPKIERTDLHTHINPKSPSTSLKTRDGGEDNSKVSACLFLAGIAAFSYRPPNALCVKN